MENRPRDDHNYERFVVLSTGEAYYKKKSLLKRLLEKYLPKLK